MPSSTAVSSTGINFLAKPFTLEELAFKVHEVLTNDTSAT